NWNLSLRCQVRPLPACGERLQCDSSRLDARVEIQIRQGRQIAGSESRRPPPQRPCWLWRRQRAADMKIQLEARILGLDHEIWNGGPSGIEQVGKRALHVQVDALARDVRGERSF